MNVASLELCEGLYKLSGWGDTYSAYGKWTPKDKKPFMADYNYGQFGHDAFRVAPAYDLGYLMRKLPVGVEIRKVLNGYSADPPYSARTKGISEVYATPEEALCKLAIELFKQGILAPQEPTV